MSGCEWEGECMHFCLPTICIRSDRQRWGNEEVSELLAERHAENT